MTPFAQGFAKMSDMFRDAPVQGRIRLADEGDTKRFHLYIITRSRLPGNKRVLLVFRTGKLDERPRQDPLIGPVPD